MLQLGAQWIRGGFQNVREVLSQAVTSIGSVIARGNPILGGLFSIGAALLGRGKGGAQQVEVVNEKLNVSFADSVAAGPSFMPTSAQISGRGNYSGPATAVVQAVLELKGTAAAIFSQVAGSGMLDENHLEGFSNRGLSYV